MRCTSLTAPLLLLITPSLDAQGTSKVAWMSFTGPLGEHYSRMGTDGTDLYFSTNSVELWRYTFSLTSPAGGSWTQLASSPRTIDGWDSYRGLAFQGGYLYASALPSSGVGRTIVRYEIAQDRWEIWGNPSGSGTDLLCNTSGNGLFMDPALSGVGYSAWHAGGWWISFDWNGASANNNWMSPSGLQDPSGQPVPDAGWVSRNECAASDGSGTFYATKNDWIAGLSGGDILYTWSHGAAPVPSYLAQKPFECGFGQSLLFFPVGHQLNHSGADELWLLRGGDCAASPHEGWSVAGTRDWSILPLSAGAQWITFETPFYQGEGSDAVTIGPYVFVKACGDAASANTYNADFYVGVSGAFAWPFGQGCPGAGGFLPLAGSNLRPVLGERGFALEVHQVEGLASLALMLGLSNTSWSGIPLPFDLAALGLPGCFLRIAVAIQTSTSAGPGAAGQAAGALTLPLPADPSLAGALAYSQWLIADSSGVSLSDGLTLYLDVR